MVHAMYTVLYTEKSRGSGWEGGLVERIHGRRCLTENVDMEKGRFVDLKIDLGFSGGG